MPKGGIIAESNTVKVLLLILQQLEKQNALLTTTNALLTQIEINTAP